MNRPGAIIIEGHVQGLSNTRSLGEAGIPVYVVDTYNCIARYSKYCTKFLLCPDFKKDEFAGFLIELAKSENLKGWILIPSNDHAVRTLSNNRSLLEKYYKVLAPDPAVLENIYDKQMLLKLAERTGIPIPVTYCFKTIPEKLPYDLVFPIIFKGRYGLSFYKGTGKKVFMAGDENSFRKMFQIVSQNIEPGEILIQEFIPFNKNIKTISFTAYCEKGSIKTFWMGEKVREHPVRFGTATFAKSIFEEKCYLNSKPLLEALKYSGICEIEYLRDPRDGEYKLIEINARTWLWVGLARACGVDFVKIAYDAANGLNPEFPANYIKNKSWINPFTDTIYSIIGILKGQITIKSYFASMRRENLVNALFIKGDSLPGLVYFLNLFTFWKRR